MQPAGNGSTVAPPAKRQQQQGQQTRQPWVKRKRGVDLAPQDRLQHTATKEIGRELKRVKAFLLQRLVKRCRRLRGHGGGKEGKDKGKSSGDGEMDEMAATAEDSPAVKACLEEIKAIKALTAESVAPVCLRRLGLAYTGSEHAGLNEAASAPGPLKQVLEHPRMATLLQSFDERVTDLRRGGDGKMKSGRKRARGEGEGDDEEDEGRGGGGAFKLERVHRKATAAHDGSSVFLDSLSGFVPLGGGRHRRGPEDDDAEDEGEEGMDTYGYREFGAAAQRKNRPGQRARRAKMEAVQAAMEGKRRGGQSSNWRKGSGGGGGGGVGGEGGGGGGGRGFGGRHGQGPDKAQRGGGRPSSSSQPSLGHSTHEPPRSRPPPPGAAATASPKQKPQQQEGTEKLHPSWAAKQAQRAKAGIGGFQGKKIKFASDE